MNESIEEAKTIKQLMKKYYPWIKRDENDDPTVVNNKVQLDEEWLKKMTKKITKEFIGKVNWIDQEVYYITDLNDPTKFILHFDQELKEMVGITIRITITYEMIIHD